jgi:putative transcriptional regulator
MMAKKKASLGERFIRAAREGRAIARGEADPSTYRVFVPADVDVGAIRREQGLTQDEFAARYGLPAATVRDWEQRRRQPDGAARALLQIIKKEPKAAARALKPEHAA